MYPPRVEILFPPVMWNSCDQTLLDFKTRFSRGSFSLCQTLRLVGAQRGLRTLTSMGKLLWYNYFPVCRLPTQQVWDLTLLWLHPSYVSDIGRDWGQEEKGTMEDEMAGWHHQLNGREFGWTPGVGDGQGGLACCNSWGREESDTTERLNWTEPSCCGFFVLGCRVSFW